MGRLRRNCKPIVAAIFCAFYIFSSGALAQEARLDPLFDALTASDADRAPDLVEKIAIEWSKSGSASMDYLLRLGRAAVEAEDTQTAIYHFTALTDHAPDFAEGWHGLGAAYYNAGMIGPAFDALGRAVAIEPRHFQAMEGIMVLLQETGRIDAALGVAARIKAIHPHHPRLSTMVDQLNAQSGRKSL